ncbi:prokaryotic type I DNA topoisomerase [Choiromyces venosus 120613-1]|uniref:DNA topoisomerase n=1 Tax=Choiromyces venosus 120613-1 TaxID=1336337 RepID=A0A3N4JUG5_9PEZI|nr:prokaryotic type I DNA topoisomerase [Choiromyces venosus 120613-1]
MGRILCVAEKPSIAKAVAGHLSGGAIRNVRNTGNKYIKNYDFTYRFPRPWGECNVTMTSVVGHTISWDFADGFRKWKDCPPSALFEAATKQFVSPEHKDVAANISSEARNAQALYIWTDCDREGEYIGTEVMDLAKKTNPRIEVKRAKFSNIERAHILHAAQNPGELDECQASAVRARIELDLRIGAAFTRWQTMLLQTVRGLDEQVVSYGSCQFPTLGFVVDRYKKVKNFIPEPFWSIKVLHKRDNINVNFYWDRSSLYDRMAVMIMYERCLAAKFAKVVSVVKKPTSKWKPLPLTTVELQKQGSRFLGLSSQLVMTIAEKLYTQGFISYPRTETDQFDKGMDLQTLVGKQTQSPAWGQFAQDLMAGGFSQPKNGTHNDKAHPPIHPVVYVSPDKLNADERRVYEFVVRRFLACCSKDARGETTTVKLQYGEEGFHTSGLVVLERNYLEVYVYDKWSSSQELPVFTPGETFQPSEATMTEGKTSPPGFLTEPELIALMDANGIGTDATMAEHIAKIIERKYVFARPTGRGGGEFSPSNLGIALVEGYDNIGFDMSLSKPFLRKEMEEKMKKICEGSMTRLDVVNSSIEQYREMFVKASQCSDILKACAQRYLTQA